MDKDYRQKVIDTAKFYGFEILEDSKEPGFYQNGEKIDSDDLLRMVVENDSLQEIKDSHFLNQLQYRMKTQDKNSQAHPRFWVIMDYKYELRPDGHEDKYIVYDNKEEEELSFEYFSEILLERIEDNLGWLYHEYDLELIESLLQEEDVEEIRNWLKYNGLGSKYDIKGVEHVGYIVPDTLFITKDSAEEHLKRYSRRYSSKAHTYSMTAIGSPEVEQLWNILENTDW